MKGKVFVYGEHVNTDLVIPGRHCHITDPVELARHCFEDLDASFVKTVEEGDYVVAGVNFGCGSSREEAATVLKASGVAGVVAASFARIFFRNAINSGLPIFECPDAVAAIRPGQHLRADLGDGSIEIVETGERFQALRFPDFLLGIVRAGGLEAYARENY